jgi:hypothetical protein
VSGLGIDPVTNLQAELIRTKINAPAKVRFEILLIVQIARRDRVAGSRSKNGLGVEL